VLKISIFWNVELLKGNLNQDTDLVTTFNLMHMKISLRFRLKRERDDIRKSKITKFQGPNERPNASIIQFSDYDNISI
jgi:hypothetical protein